MRPVSRRIVRARTVSSSPLQLEGADDDLCGADDLAETDHRGVAERGHRRHAKPLECPQPIVAHDRGHAKRLQIVGEEHGGAFAEPVARAARGTCSRTGSRGAGRPAMAVPRRRLRQRRCRGQQRHQEYDPPGHGATENAECVPEGQRLVPPCPGVSVHQPVASVGRTRTVIRHWPPPVARHCSVPTSTSRLNRYIRRRMADA